MTNQFSRYVPYGNRSSPPPHHPTYNPLFALAKELESRLIGAAVDTSISVVDAYLPAEPIPESAWIRASTSSSQRAILRPDPISCHPWWWLLWPGERFEVEDAEPEVERLLPAERVEEVARRVRNILVLDGPV